MGVGRQDVKLQVPGELAYFLGYAFDEFTVFGNGAVVIQDQMFNSQRVGTGDEYFDHCAPLFFISSGLGGRKIFRPL
jgi:hypothetical protein